MTVKLKCPYCHFSKTVPRNKIPANAKYAVCPSCKQRFELAIPKDGPDFFAEEPESESGGRDPGQGERAKPRYGAPWENRVTLGIGQAIYQTYKATLFMPRKLFGNLTYKAGIREPLAFGLLLGSLGGMLGFFWQFLVFASGLLSRGPMGFAHFTASLVFVITLLVIPIFVVLSIFIYSGILHLFLLVTRGGGNGFEASFRVVAYSQAAQAFGLVPFVGTWVGAVWQLIVQIIGLREIHETSYWRVILAFLIPVLAIILIGVAVLIPLLMSFIRQPAGQLWS
jgi:hypothetical protein